MKLEWAIFHAENTVFGEVFFIFLKIFVFMMYKQIKVI